jgi:DNA-binding transcriptional regulator YiaG
MPQQIDFAALVRLLREHQGLTQGQFAHPIGVSFGSVNVWDNGKRTPLPILRKAFWTWRRTPASAPRRPSFRRHKGVSDEAYF